MIQELPVNSRGVPSLAELVEGQMARDEIRSISIDDLLGRDEVEPRQELLDRCIRGQVVMVTGAGGSIGSELCRQIIRLNPQKLVLFEQSEFALYQIHQELTEVVQAANLDIPLIPILGSVGDRNQVDGVLGALGVHTIYHAAAYKHVPLVEFNIVAGTVNNALATWELAESAIAFGVRSFVLVSTDKAVRPASVMGASKRLAELVLQALHRRGSRTRFCIVRFGNVLGSSGSVVPLFKQQIAEGGPVTVTDPDVTRYFMTIPEAAGLLLQAGSMGEGGDVFLLDMGDAVKIIDLARLMIRLAGLSERTAERPDGDIEILFTGLRPGEKLAEDLLASSNVCETEHPMIMRAHEEGMVWSDLEPRLIALTDACANANPGDVRALLGETISDFMPEGDILDFTCQHELRNKVTADT